MNETGKISAIEMIYKRHAVRDYTPADVDAATVRALLTAAAQAPSASNRQPWAFVVIQNRALLNNYSNEIKASFPLDAESRGIELQYREMFKYPNFNVFYNAGTLIVIYARGLETALLEECCFAAENLMIAACDMGLGSCPIGFARPWFGLPKTKIALGVPAEYEIVLPIIVGYPTAVAPAAPRKDPEILSWKR